MSGVKTIEIPDSVMDSDAPSRSNGFELIHETKLGNRALVVHNFLSLSECDKLISFIDSYHHQPLSDDDITLVPANNNKKYRNNLRICAQSDRISNILYSRLLPILQELKEDEKQCDDTNAHLHLNEGLGMRGGKWILDSINPCFRLCKYETSGHFSPHYDGDYVIDPLYHRSMKTFMIYLNENYLEGTTNFLESFSLSSSNIDPIKGVYLSPKEYIIASYKAKQRDCLIFDHKIAHEGDMVMKGFKYIMRSDIMYKKHVSLDDVNNITEEQMIEEKAIRIFYEGMALDAAGQVDQACQKYRIACKLCPKLEFGV